MFILLCLVCLSGAQSPVAAAPGAAGFAERAIWARNVGGAALTNRAGEHFGDDDCSTGAGRCGSLGEVARTQSPQLFRTYRSGDQSYSVDVSAGDYDVLLYFVEPDALAGEARRFDVLIEDRVVLENFNVLRAQGMQAAAAVTRAIPALRVDDGSLDIELRSRSGEAVLAGLQVRQARFSTAGWELLWSDEFDQGELDTASWTREVWPAGKVNDEDQEYTASGETVRVEGGLLILEAHYQGPEPPAFASGRIHSSGHRDLLYGRLDVRARLPEGRGVWPAIWLMPSDPYRYASNCGPEMDGDIEGDGCDAWPNSGEIDLMEHVGYEPGVVHGTVHTRDYYHGLGTQIGEAILVPDLGKAFHTYSLVWEEGRLAMYVDGHRYFAYFDDGAGSGQWPFDHPFHVILNLAVGGTWGRAGGAIDIGAFPQRLEVDHVRIYAPSAASTPTPGAPQ